jgi:hypothetical protein
MIYSVKFINNFDDQIKTYEDVYGERQLIIEPGTSEVKFPSVVDNIWCPFSKVVIDPVIIDAEELLANGNTIKVKKTDGWKIKTHKRRGFKSPIPASEEHLCTTFLNEGSDIRKEFWGLAGGRKVVMLKGVPVKVRLDLFEYHQKYKKIIIKEPIVIRKTEHQHPGWFRLERRQNVEMIPKSQNGIKKILKDREMFEKKPRI